jgi:hypothetical protein
MNLENTLFNKDGLNFARVRKNQYKLAFNMENKNIFLSKIIDFSLIKLIYDLSPDIYELVNIEKINDNETITTLSMKYLFEGFGSSQRVLYIHMKRIVEENKITFKTKEIKLKQQPNMPEDSDPLYVQEFSFICDIITPHSINFSVNIIFDQQMGVIHFAEKIVGMILHKIFKRVKLFIEQMKM